MTKKQRIPINVRQTKDYKVVIVKTGEVVAKFRLRQTANELLRELKKMYVDELKIMRE